MTIYPSIINEVGESTLFKKLLYLFNNFFKDYFNIIFSFNEYIPPRHNIKFTNEYYLNHILNLLSYIMERFN
jgi:hypothetical protein